MDNKQLQVIVKESGLQKTEAEEILETFNNIFALVGEWEKEAFDINITHESQIVDMQRAGVGRKVIQRVRLDLEKERKRKKENSLRRGQTIDAIAKVYRTILEPIEDHLDKQEHYIEIKAKEEARVRREKYEKEQETERLRKVNEDCIEQARIRKENAQLKRALDEKNKKLLASKKEVRVAKKTIQTAESNLELVKGVIVKKDEEIKEIKLPPYRA